MRSTSRLSLSPAWRSPQVVTARVWGMMRTENRSPSTELTVSVEPAARLAPAPGGDREGGGDEENGEQVAVHGIDRERGAVEADRALLGDEGRKTVGRPDDETGRGPPGVAPRRDRLPGHDGGQSVHMPRDHMAAEFVA